MSSYSGLSAKHREQYRAAVRVAVDLSFAHSAQIDYTEDATLRWDWKRYDWLAVKGEFPHDTDCSGWFTWAHFQGAHLLGLKDRINGQDWLGGYTGTLLDHGKLVHHEGNAQFGDAAIYGVPGTTGKHVALCIGGGLVASHGSPGIHKLDLHYRSDLMCIRRYV